MRWKASKLALVAISMAFAGAAQANHLAPTSESDCSLFGSIETVFQSRMDAIDQQAASCEQANAGQGQWISACGKLGPRNCEPVYQQACSIDDARKRLQDQCLDRLNASKARQQREEKRRKDQEQAERADENAARFGQQVPQSVAAGIIYGMGNLRGAEGLSQALTQGGLEAVDGIQKRALGQLMRRMEDTTRLDRSAGGHNASNPRLSGSRIDAILSLLNEPDRIGQGAGHVPAGQQSLVSGAYAAIATQIAEAYLRGDIDAPLDAIHAAAAAMVEWRTAQAAADTRSGANGDALALVEDLRARQRSAAQEMQAALQSPSPSPPATPPKQPLPPITPDPPETWEPMSNYGMSSCAYGRWEDKHRVDITVHNRCRSDVILIINCSNRSGYNFSLRPGHSKGVFRASPDMCRLSWIGGGE